MFYAIHNWLCDLHEMTGEFNYSSGNFNLLLRLRKLEFIEFNVLVQC
jgi:hypothetical protein